MTTVLCVGTAVVDFVFHLHEHPREAEKYKAETAEIVGGGCAANAAVAIARLGGSAILGARLGDDAIGDSILTELNAEGVNVSHVTRTQGARSSYSSVYINSAGERQIVNFRGSGLILDTNWFAELADTGAVLADTRQVEAAIDALELAKARSIPGIVDGEAPIDPAILIPASHAAFSMQGLTALVPGTEPDAALLQIAREFECWSCVTDGENGVWFTDAKRVEHIPAFPVRPVDTLAAGDIWHGAFALALAEGQDEPSAVRFASAAAALKCMKTGGRDGCPTRSELNEFLKENTK
jgi:sulfofructose kinase